MKTIKIIAAVVMAGALSGCLSNKYEEFYVDTSPSEKLYIDNIAANKEPVVLKTVTTEDDVINLLEDGYVAIGHSSFNASYTPYSCAVDTAEKHGASLVLLDVRFKEEKSYTSVMFLPSYSTSYHSGTASATAFGSGGSATAFGSYSGTTTTTTMNAVPVQRSERIYKHDAMFFKKVARPDEYGVLLNVPKRLPGEGQDEAIDVKVIGVLHGSKAEQDGLKRGQIVKRINGHEICTRKDVLEYVSHPALIKNVEVAK